MCNIQVFIGQKKRLWDTARVFFYWKSKHVILWLISFALLHFLTAGWLQNLVILSWPIICTVCEWWLLVCSLFDMHTHGFRRSLPPVFFFWLVIWLYASVLIEHSSSVLWIVLTCSIEIFSKCWKVSRMSKIKVNKRSLSLVGFIWSPPSLVCWLLGP